MFDNFGKIIAGVVFLLIITFVVVLVIYLIIEYFGGVFVLLVPLTLWFIGLFVSRYWS